MATPRSDADPIDSPAAKRLYLHIGEPKTGSTFLQRVLWSNRAELATHGIQLPGHHPQDHYRATQDVLAASRDPDDPTATWSGEWDLLAQLARTADRASVISHELFCAADAQQAARAVQSLTGVETHLILTVREMATLLPAEWQESVKHRYASSYAEWLRGVIDEQSTAPNRRAFWFWRVHDTLEILRVWGAVVPADRIHVVITPRRDAPRDELWRRFASVLGVDPASVDITRAGHNASLGVVESEFLRRFNASLGEDVPQWFYLSDVKEPLAHGYLEGRPRSARITLPPERVDWANEQNTRLRAGLLASGVDIVGNPDDLLAPPGDPVFVDPETVPAADLVAVAVGAAAALAADHYRAAHTTHHPRGGGKRGLLTRVEDAVAGSPRLKRMIRTATARSATVRRIRVLVWRQLERTRRRSG